MKTTTVPIFLILFLTATMAAQAQTKPRIIIVTDMTHDDGNTLIRYLHYANEFKLEAMIVTPQLPDFQYNSLAPWNKAQTIIDAYGQVENQLRKHRPDFPTATAVRNVTKKGRGALPIIWLTNGQRFWDWVGEGNTPNGEPKDSEGSAFLQTIFENPDPSPIYVQFWGGPITFMQALYRYKQNHTAQQLSTLLNKLYVYDISHQDITIDMMLSISAMKGFSCGRWDNATGTYGQTQLIPAAFATDTGHFWDYLNAMSPNEVKGNGALSNLYDGGGEGDTPVLLVNISHTLGLNDARIPSLGSWGNMYPKVGGALPVNYHATCKGDKNELTRWKPDAKNSFLARLKWAVNEPGNVNRPPRVSVNGDNTNKIMYIDVNPGTVLNFNASASTDPDGNSLSYRWFQYAQADSYSGTLTINNSTSNQISVTLPGDLNDRNIHIVLEVRDNGSPGLVAYKRIIAGKDVKDPFSPSTSMRVTGVSVSPASSSISVGTNTTLTATVSPSNATNKNVTWSSSNTAVATVNSSGLVTGVSTGTATITVRTDDGGETATSSITVTGATSSTTYLSDLPWASATVGYGTIKKDQSLDGNPIRLNGTTYAKGIGTHAVSNITYNLGAAYNTFSAVVGLDDEITNTESCGSVIFKVYCDGVIKYTSPKMLANSTSANVQVDVTNVNTLQLSVEEAGNGNCGDHGDWADAKVITSGGSQDPTYVLSISSPNGTVTKNPNKAVYNTGELVTLTATANSGYVFNNWSGGASGGRNPLTITMSSNKNITANFTQITTPACNLFQAETSYTGSGVTVASGNGSAGSGYVDFGGQGTYTQWTVNVPSAGSYALRFKYANGSTSNRQCGLTTNGSTVGNVNFGPTADWQTWVVAEITATLNGGNNTIQLTANTSAGGPNIDNYEVCGAVASASLSNVRVVSHGMTEEESDSSEFSLNVFPNPVSQGELNSIIQTPGQRTLRISIVDAMGRILFTQQMTTEHSLHHSIDCSNFPPGVYLLKASDGRWQKASKVIIK